MLLQHYKACHWSIQATHILRLSEWTKLLFHFVINDSNQLWFDEVQNLLKSLYLRSIRMTRVSGMSLSESGWLDRCPTCTQTLQWASLHSGIKSTHLAWKIICALKVHFFCTQNGKSGCNDSYKRQMLCSNSSKSSESWIVQIYSRT